MAGTIRIFEVGPRDGLQNEKRLIATADKVRLVDMLSETGLTHIEVTSFVSARWVPQMADAAEVMAAIARRPAVSYAALTPNLKGLEAALAAKVDEVAIFGAASEGFSQKNINCSIAESFERFAPLAERALAAGIKVRGYVSCVTHCPYDGATPPERVAEVAARLDAMGCYEVSLGETLGRARPDEVGRMLAKVVAAVPATRLAGHFHDTDGRALDNIGVAIDAGLRVFDSSVGGLGGCPYAPGAKGNVATERVVAYVEARGFRTGIDRDRLDRAARFARTLREDTPA